MNQKSQFLRRLRSNQSGNVMYLTAGLLVPILATIGAGVDLGQAYMAKARLQQACDAGVLSGRRAMGEGSYSAAARQSADRMFHFNYPTGQYGAVDLNFTTSQRGNNEVTGTATATVPTIIMNAFGRDSIQLAVNCTARLETSNADIMLVLDTTGSMTSINPGDSVSRIQALRNEVMSFYDTVMAAQSSTSVIRFGIVPYSSNVNVGNILRTANPNWISNSVTIPSRTINWVVTGTSGPSTTWSDVSGFSSWTNTGATISGKNSSSCPATVPSPQYAIGAIQSGPTVTTSSSGTNPVTTTTTTVTNYNATKYRYVWSSSQCRLQSAPGVRRETVTGSETRTANYVHSNRAFDVSSFKMGSSLTEPLGTLGANVSATWNGCIQERDTVAFASTVGSVPSDAYDLNIDLVPNSEATRWRVFIPQFAFPRTTSPSTNQTPTPANMTTTTDIPSYATGTNATGGWSACPSPAMKLTAIPTAQRSTLQTYVNNLVAIGGTYHDVGMIWGTRLMSPTGIFASENGAAANGNPISRHLIFMTDGELAPNRGIYGFQSQEYLAGRVGAPSTAEFTARHEKRFQMACNAAKSRNITVWVISFGLDLNDSMRACASGDKAYTAANTAQLRTHFQSIASQITRLRLSE